LTAASHKLAEAMYKAQSGTQQNGPQGGTGGGTQAGGQEKPKDDNVVDAEFVDVDDKK
jgi:molecular chaperone DnaK